MPRTFSTRIEIPTKQDIESVLERTIGGFNQRQDSVSYGLNVTVFLLSKAHDHIPSPYQVSLDGGEPISVDPKKLKEKGIRLDCVRESQYVLHIKGKTIPVVIEAIDRKNIRLSSNNRVFEAVVRDHRDQLLAEWGLDETSQKGAPEVNAPMPGLVLSVAVTEGQTISTGDPLLVLEAMKMENEIKASFDAVVKSVNVSPGDAVQKGQLLIVFGYES